MDVEEREDQTKIFEYLKKWRQKTRKYQQERINKNLFVEGHLCIIRFHPSNLDL